MNIIIVDDHPLVRQGLAAVISIERDMDLVGEASTATEAEKLVITSKPDIALIDLMLNDASGLEIVINCRKAVPLCKFIILTSSADPDAFRKARDLNVDGYILKEAFPEEILSAIRIVHRGRKYYDPGLVDCLLRHESDLSFEGLSTRERQILLALGDGLNNKEIAKKFFITENTVKKHVSQVLAKLQLSDRTQAALYAKESRGKYIC